MATPLPNSRSDLRSRRVWTPVLNSIIVCTKLVSTRAWPWITIPALCGTQYTDYTHPSPVWGTVHKLHIPTLYGTQYTNYISQPCVGHNTQTTHPSPVWDTIRRLYTSQPCVGHSTQTTHPSPVWDTVHRLHMSLLHIP